MSNITLKCISIVKIVTVVLYFFIYLIWLLKVFYPFLKGWLCSAPLSSFTLMPIYGIAKMQWSYKLTVSQTNT